MGRIKLKGLPNTRDLGGMVMENGAVIRKDRLIRSGALGRILPEDLEILKGHALSLIEDFRTSQEIEENPDRPCPGISYIRIPIIEDMEMGLSREKSLDDVLFSGQVPFMKNEETAAAFMKGIYRNFASSPFSQKQYAKFFDLLASREEGAVLFHCTAGKDRAGFAAAMLLEVLGASRETVMEDYMATSVFLKDMTEALLERKAPKEVRSRDFDAAFMAAMGTRREYLAAIYEYAGEAWGSFDAYLEKAIGLTEDKRERLRSLYLA